MKLNENRPYLEMSGEIEDKFFSIQDQGMIFDILRNKMYSNPILAIAREISCNARDAHREVGTPEIPIQIHLPNSLEPEYRVRDFGPGISPDRMSNIFIKYTASTKRDSNVQTGGFGLGAKTPFSYSDAFAIVTNHNGTQYHYNCVIDSTKVGKLMLGSECPTNEPNGTEIIIPVLPKNFNDFAIWTEQACRHWDVKPTIVGGSIKWHAYAKILEGSNWAITIAEDHRRNAKMIVDGVEYPLDLETLRKYADDKLINSSRGNFIMYFGVGELSLSASREQIYLDEKTQKIVRDRLESIQREIKQNVIDKIKTMPNLWQANIYYRRDLRQAFHTIQFLGTLDWNGIPLRDEYMHLKCSVYSFVKGGHRRYNADPNKISRQLCNHISFEEAADLYVNDLAIKEPTPRHVKKAFDDNPQLKSLFVVCPNDKVTLADLNKELHLDKMEPKLLSNITKASARSSSGSSARLIIFKFDKGSVGFRQVSHASLDEDVSEKILCLLTKDSYGNQVNRCPILKSNDRLPLQTIKTLCTKFPDVSFYGVDSSTPQDRIEDDFSDFIDLESFIKKALNSWVTNWVEVKFARQHYNSIDDRMLRHFSDFKKLIKDPQSLSLKRLELHQKMKKLNQVDTSLLSIYESFNGDIDDAALSKYEAAHPEHNIVDIDDKFNKKYPLLEFIQTYDYSSALQAIADYLNLVDKQ